MPTDRMLIQNFTRIKTLPNVAIHLIKLISDTNSTIQDIEEVIRLDSTLVLRLMRLVNSPFYALREKVHTIAGAVMYTGMENLRSMIVVEALKDIFKNAESGGAFSQNQLWMHCAVVGICSKMISERIFMQNGENAFLCGILHDIGMIVENQVEGELFIRTCNAYEPDCRPFREYEDEIIGTNHCIVGHLVARDWKLPAEVQDGIKYHHEVMTGDFRSSMSGIIQIAEYITTRLSPDYAAIPKMTAVLSPDLVEHIRDNLRDYRFLIRDLPEEISRARDIYQLSDTND